MKLLFRAENMHFVKNSKRGFIAVEAAIILPIFLIGVLTFAYLIKLVTVQEAVMHAFTDEAKRLSAEASFYPIDPFFKSRLANRIYGENPIDVKNIDIDNYQYLYNISGAAGMISVDLNYQVDIRLPITFYNDLPIYEKLVFRGFIGAEEDWEPMPFEDMEKETDSQLVWIFPRAGGRYHGEDCTYISADPREMLLSGKVRSQYKPCSICKPSEIKNGNFVYCFIKSGEVYHRGSCPVVDRYVISIEKEEAIERGYTPCLKCGGN